MTLMPGGGGTPLYEVLCAAPKGMVFEPFFLEYLLKDKDIVAVLPTGFGKSVLLPHFKPLETFQYTNFCSRHPPGVMKVLNKGKTLKLLRTNSSQRTFEYIMEFTSLHDFYGSWHMYIWRSLFGHSTFFVALLVFMKGSSCCVIRWNFKWSWAV